MQALLWRPDTAVGASSALPGTAYAYGTIEVLANFMFAPAIVLGSMMFANFMRKKAELNGGLTVPEYIAATHIGSEKEKRIVHGVAAVATFIFLSVYMIGQIKAVGLVAAEWLNVSEVVAAILLMLVVTIFTMQGGLLAVAVTDTIMCVGMLIASVIVYVVITKDISITELITQVGQIKPELTNPVSSAPYGQGKNSVFLVFIYALLFTTILPYMSVRFLSLKEDIKLHKMGLFMAPMGVILSVVPIVGLYMLYKNPGLENPDSAMPVFLNTYLSPLLGGIVTLFILFAMLSTISSVLQALASALSYDMFTSIVNKNPKHGGLINRITVLFTSAWTLFLTFVAPQGMLNQIAYIGTGGLIAMFVGPIMMRTIMETNLKTCFASMVVGFLSNVLLVFVFKAGWVEAPIIAGALGSVVYLAMGYVTNNSKVNFEKKEKEKNNVILNES